MARPQIPLVALTHPFELVLGVILIVNAGRGLAGDVTPSLLELPMPALLLYLGVSTVGGVGLVAGLCWPSNPRRRPVTAPISTGVAVERAALFLVAASYAGLAVMVLNVNASRGAAFAVVCGLVAVGCLLRTVAIRRTTKAMLTALTRRRLELEGGADA